ncbi:hypothetical protein F4604DRAFT_760859 [Suillus subluteus]|nr:hypothetical protein F4604DRAFT_760859 [Suillus subluteus]
MPHRSSFITYIPTPPSPKVRRLLWTCYLMIACSPMLTSAMRVESLLYCNITTMAGTCGSTESISAGSVAAIGMGTDV